MICNNRHCWRCQRVHKRDKKMAKKGFYPFNVGGLDCVYIKVALDKDKIQVSGSGGGS